MGQAVAQYQVHYEGEGEPVDLGGVTVRLRLYRDGELLDITRVRRSVSRLHPIHLAPLIAE